MFSVTMPAITGTLPVDAAKKCTGFGCASLELTAGTLRGNVWDDGNEFLTVPYATAKRFDEPVTLTKLPGGTFDATNIWGDGRAECLQQPYYETQDSYGVEDCLIMNIYTPHEQPDGALRPMLVWIFGGDNTASEIIPYNATKLAGRHGAVVATVSYRLGGLGWAAFEEDVGKGTGNAGMHDILSAITWLKREAARLGADGERIVVFGESSGATDAQILTLAPAARGLVSGSIGESGGLYAQSLAGALNNTRQMARAAGCDGGAEGIKACMRKASGAALMNGSAYLDWGPTIDGVFLPDHPAAMLAAGQLNPGTSVIYGANTNDSAHPESLRHHVSERDYIAQLNASVHGARPPEELDGLTRRQLAGRRHKRRVLRDGGVLAAATAAAAEGRLLADDLLTTALQIYPPRRVGNNAALVGWFESDRFMCSTRREVLAASKAASAGGAAFMYRFDWWFQSSSSCIADSNYHAPQSGSNHCDEMTFVFGQPIFDNQDPPGLSYTNCSDPASTYYDQERCTGCAFDTREAPFALAVGRLWSSFASGSRSPEWPPFTAAAPRDLVLHPDAQRLEVNLSRPEACALWDEVARRFP